MATPADPRTECWPPPRHFQLDGRVCEPRRIPEPETRRDPTLPPEHYRLEFGDNHCRLSVADEAGERHGTATLAQLRRIPTSLACGTIDDGPDYPIRGIMLDISRDRIPRGTELYGWVDRVAALKGNHLQLYTEHSIRWPDHDRVWAMSDALDLDEVSRLRAYAAEKSVDLVINQNCFGHMERWLRRAPYAALGELSDVARRLDQGANGPFSLCPVDDRAQALAMDLVDQGTALGGSFFGIGCDETVDLGEGRSAGAIAAEGYDAVYGRFVGALARRCLSAGAKPLVWADMALAHPAALQELPPESIALAWNYEAEDLGERWAEALGGAGLAWWACPGTSAWNSFSGRGDARDGSILAAARCRQRGASGMITTEWGDFGHRQPEPVARFGLAQGLGAAWNTAAAVDPNHRAIASAAGFAAELGPWLDACSRHDEGPRAGAVDPWRERPLINRNLLFTDSQVPWSRQDWLPQPEQWKGLAEQLAALAQTRPPSGDALVDKELAYGLRALDWMAQRALARRGARSIGSLARDCRSLAEQHRGLWLQRARPGGLADSCAHWERLAQEIERHA